MYFIEEDGFIRITPILDKDVATDTFICPLCHQLNSRTIVGDGVDWKVENCPKCGVHLNWKA